MGIAVELQSVEHSYHTNILHPSVLYDGIKDNLSVGIHVLQLMPGNMLQEGRNREDGTCCKPATHVVATHVVEHRVVRNLEDVVLQFLQRRYTEHLFLGFRIAEYKVAKTHVFLHQVVQVHIHLGRVLINKVETLGLGFCFVANLRRVENQGHIFIAATNLPQQFQTCLRIAFLYVAQPTLVYLHGESGITNHA